MKTKSNLTEKKLTKAELEAREKVIKDLKKNKSALVKRYGKDAEAVMYGRATNIAKKMAESENKNRIKEMVRKALMQEADIEVDADKYEGEQELGQVSAMMDELESMLKHHDWFYFMSDDPRVYNNDGPSNRINALVRKLTDLGYGEDAKALYNQYVPKSDIDLSMKEAKGKDMDKDGDIDSDDYLAARDAAIKKAMQKEDIDLGHEDNEPHMIKAELYRIGKYAMELYQMVDEFEGMGEVDFPAWWQSKITTAMNNMVSAKHYLDFELKEPAIDAAVDALTGEEPHEGEPEIEEGIHDRDITSAPHTNIKGEMGAYDPSVRAASLKKLANFGPKKKIKEDSNIEILKKSLEEYLTDGTIDEGFLDRLKANVKGAVAGVGQAAKNVGAAVKGDASQFVKTSDVVAGTKLAQKTKTLGKELDDAIKDLNIMFPEEKLNKDPKLKDTIKKYIDLLNQTKIASTTISNIKPSTGADTTTTSTSSSSTTTATKTTPARDEKGRFVSNKPTTDTKTAAAAPTNVKPISNNYTVTKDTYSYKGKNYPVQIDKQTKEKFFKGDDGRIMDIAALEKMSQAKKKTTGVAEKIAEKLAKQLKSK